MKEWTRILLNQIVLTCRAQNMEKNNNMHEVRTFRRILPQIFGAMAKNLIIFNLGQFGSFTALVIPSLLGMSNDLNPDETIRVSASQTPILVICACITTPIGAVLSGPACDKFGRRKLIQIATIPLALAWLSLGFAQSFPIICIGLAVIGFCMGLKEAPSLTFVSEISEPSIRGALATVGLLTYQAGNLLVFSLGLILSWRQIAFTCALSPMGCFVLLLFIEESPMFLLSQNKVKEAEKSLQWFRGWTTPQAIQKEFAEIQNYCDESTACTACAKRSIKCEHPKPTFCDKLKELKRKRTLKPIFIVLLLYFFFEACILNVVGAYIVLVIKACGMQINANKITVLISVISMLSCIFLLATIKRFGRRPLYLASSSITSLCSIALAMYGFVFIPPGWTLLGEHSSEAYENIQLVVGNFSYLALVLILILQFAAKFGVFGLPNTFNSELFPLKTRSFLCGIGTANHYLIATLLSKTFYNIDQWFTLPGALLFYSFVSVTGLVVMYFILPETEGRTLEQIELHFSDNSKRITDIYISKDRNQINSNRSNNNGQTVSD